MADQASTLRYHTSLPANRASIAARGLLARNPLHDFNEAVSTGDPVAVYLWPDLDEIDDPVFDPYDIYEVQPHGPSQWRCTNPIASSRLTPIRPALI